MVCIFVFLFCACSLYLPLISLVSIAFRGQAVFCLLTWYFLCVCFPVAFSSHSLVEWVCQANSRTILSFFQIVLVLDFVPFFFFSFFNLELVVRLFNSSLKKDKAILSETSGKRKLVCLCWGRAKREMHFVEVYQWWTINLGDREREPRREGKREREREREKEREKLDSTYPQERLFKKSMFLRPAGNDPRVGDGLVWNPIPMAFKYTFLDRMQHS